MTALLLPFDSADCAALSEMLEDKARLHLAAKRLVAAVYDAQHADCEDCQSERITVSWELCRVTPCPRCRRADYTAFMAKLARDAEDPEHPCPPTLRTGMPSYHRLECDCPECLTVAETGIESRDPFTLEPDPITLTPDEVREANRRFYKDYEGPNKDTDGQWRDGQ